MGLKTIVFRFVDAMPSRIGAAVGTIMSIAAALYPSELRHWTDWLMSAEQVRELGLVGAILFIAYWAAWFWLRRSLQYEQTSGVTQNFHGTTGHVIGNVQTAHFLSVEPISPIHIAAASETVQILKEIEKKYCRSDYLDVLNLLQIDATLRNNIVLSVGSNLGPPYVKKECFEASQNFFEGGGAVLNFNVADMVAGPVPSIELPKDRIVYVNFTKQAADIKSELSNLARSPFIPNEVSEHIKKFAESVHNLYTQMIELLDECFQKQRVRLIMAANDPLVAAGLCNEFLDRATRIEIQISALRDAIRKELSVVRQ